MRGYLKWSAALVVALMVMAACSSEPSDTGDTGDDSEAAGATMAFVVRPFFYQTPWFIGLVAATGGVGGPLECVVAATGQTTSHGACSQC